MERSPVIGWVFHIRVAGLLSVLGLLDYLLIMYAYQSTLAKGATVQLVFGFEYAILITMVANTTIKYVLHASELRSDTPWESKAVFLLYTELVIGLIRVIFYIVFVFLMVKIYTLPLFAFRPMYYTIRYVQNKLCRRAISWKIYHWRVLCIQKLQKSTQRRHSVKKSHSQHEYLVSRCHGRGTDAIGQHLHYLQVRQLWNSDHNNKFINLNWFSGRIWSAIPRNFLADTFSTPFVWGKHYSLETIKSYSQRRVCRSWFQRQQTCPTCRLNILRAPAAAAQPQAPLNNNNARPNEPVAAAQANPFLNLLNQSGLGNQQAPAGTSASGNSQAFVPGAAMPPPFFFPTLPFMAPYTIPPPPMPQNLDQLTLEELRAMEGHERKHVEERLKLLRNVQTMLNASTALMNQYQMVVSSLPPIPVPTPAAPAPTTSAPSSTSETPKVSDDPTPSTSQSEVRLEDVGSEDTPAVSSSKIKTAFPEVSSTSAATSSFIASESSASTGEIEETNEVRKRRLQKFLQSDWTFLMILRSLVAS